MAGKDYLKSKWEKDSWGQRWILGMEAEPDVALETVPEMGYVCGLFPRVAAWLIDSILVCVMTLAFVASMVLVGVDIYPDTGQGHLYLFFGMVIIVILMKNAYYTLFQGNNGQTIGQAVLGIRLVDEFGDTPSFNRILRRRSARFISMLLLGVGYLWMIFNPDRQTLHDKIAGTYVVMA